MQIKLYKLNKQTNENLNFQSMDRRCHIEISGIPVIWISPWPTHKTSISLHTQHTAETCKPSVLETTVLAAVMAVIYRWGKQSRGYTSAHSS